MNQTENHNPYTPPKADLSNESHLLEILTMSRSDFAWIVVRALGVITLWFLAISIFSFLIYLPVSFYIIHTMSDILSGTSKWSEIQINLLTGLAGRVVEIVMYALLARYFLKKGTYVHRLICKHIPAA